MKATVVVRTFKIGSAAFDKTNGLVKRSQIASVEVNLVFWTDQGAKLNANCSFGCHGLKRSLNGLVGNTVAMYTPGLLNQLNLVYICYCQLFVAC